MRVFILKHGIKSDAEELAFLLKNKCRILFATPLKDSIYYILEDY